jgi:hypothetical protein
MEAGVFGFVGAPAFRPVKLRQKEAGFSPGAVRQFPHKYWRSLEKSAGAKARNQIRPLSPD